MNQPNQALLEEPYLQIKVISGYNLLKSTKENRETVEKNESFVLNQQDQNQKDNIIDVQDEQYLINKHDSNQEEEGQLHSFIQIRKDQSLAHPYNISVSIHTPSSLLFQTPSFKTYNGQVSFDQNEQLKNKQSQYNDLFKEKAHSLEDSNQICIKQSLHKRSKSTQLLNNSQIEKKMFLKDLSKYIMVDVMDSDCYMENTLISTQVIPIEFFSIPTNAGKKWKIWLKMNKYSDESSLENKRNETHSPTKLRSLSIYCNKSSYDFNNNEKSFAKVITSAEMQIEQISGINTSNFENYLVEVSPPKNHNIYSSDQFKFKAIQNEEDNTSAGSKADLSNNSSKRDSPKNNKQDEINEQSSKQDQNQNNKQSQLQQNNDMEINKQDSIMSQLDKNFSWIQLEVVLMDIGSLMKIKADIVSILEIERIGKPNLFYYNIVVTRNDGLIYLVKRRFKQFFYLKNQLQSNIKKVQYFKFPSRSISKISSLFFQKSYLRYSEQASERKEMLQEFLDSITELDEVYKEDSFIEFFTSGCQLDPEIDASEI